MIFGPFEPGDENVPEIIKDLVNAQHEKHVHDELKQDDVRNQIYNFFTEELSLTQLHSFIKIVDLAADDHGKVMSMLGIASGISHMRESNGEVCDNCAKALFGENPHED